MHMDIPVTHLSHQGLEVKPASVRRPEDILRSMAVKRPSHRPNTHSQSISQTPHSHPPSHTHALSNQIPVVTHTHLTHSQSITDDNTSAAPFQQITHTQMPPQVTPTQQAIPVMHTSQVVQIPLIQQLTHTQQRAHVAHTSHTAHTQRAQQDEKECVAAPPHPPDLCVSVEDPYFSPALSPTTEECSANGHRFRPPQLTLNEQPLQQCSQPHTGLSTHCVKIHKRIHTHTISHTHTHTHIGLRMHKNTQMNSVTCQGMRECTYYVHANTHSHSL